MESSASEFRATEVVETEVTARETANADVVLPAELTPAPLFFSVFTPTHAPAYLGEAYASLLRQTEVKWEWVICPNNGAKEKIPQEVLQDPRVRIIEEPPMAENAPARGVGYYKRLCCDAAKGDVFVELDHDDMLVPGILARVERRVHEGAGFVFSDSAMIVPEGKSGYVPEVYSPDYGWESYPIQVYGNGLLATRSFHPVNPRSLCEVYFAPDHVRCWTRDAYYRAGGHDPGMEVGDDHDLICRTYLTGVVFAHTGTCGYIYRMHPQNTVTKRNAKIQMQTQLNKEKYLWKLIDQWIDREGLGFFDFGQREHRKSLAFDAQGIPTLKLESNSQGCVRLYDYLHRLPMPEALRLINEAYRVLVPGGWLCIAVPDGTTAAGLLPYAKSHWTPHSIDYLTQKKYADVMNAEMPNSRFTGRFQSVQIFHQPAADKNQANAGGRVVLADLMAIKDAVPDRPVQRYCGKILI